jgi:hypothetical protein
VGDGKTIELRGGALNGKRVRVPESRTQVSLQVDPADKLSAWVVYRPASDRCADGVQIWDEYIETRWGDTDIIDV